MKLLSKLTSYGLLIEVSDGRGNTNNVMQIAPTSVEKLDDEPDDTGPMFSHECLGDDRSHEDPQENHTSPKSKTPLDPSPEHNGFILKRGIGENYEDPRLEVFPSDNCESIVAAIRQIEASTKEDRSIPEETSSSPTMPIIVGSNGNLPVSELQSQRLKAPKISRGSMHSDRSYTSLESIQETPEVGIRRMPVGISESAITDSADEEDDNIDVAGSDDGPDQSKRSTSPAIAADELDPVQPTLTLETPSDEDENVGKTVSSTARVESSLLRKRGPANPSERPASPTSGRSIQEASKHGNWLQGILRIVFVEWVGGFFSRVFRSFRREA
ncbi:hypothetical protein BX600DRAFT_433220 [Xylariales sp. PMI_506]|nr:hypothetical protein BX600DRAFT_433220 [Xylariales sp. PMI_506]